MISTIINAYFSNININKYPVIIDVHLQWKEGHDKRQSCIQDCILILLCFKLFCWCEATKIFLSFPDKSFWGKKSPRGVFCKKILSDTAIHLDTLVNKKRKRKKEKLEKPGLIGRQSVQWVHLLQSLFSTSFQFSVSLSARRPRIESLQADGEARKWLV